MRTFNYDRVKDPAVVGPVAESQPVEVFEGFGIALAA